MRWIGRISPRPLLIVRAREDSEFPSAATDALEEAAGANLTTFESTGGHGLFNAPDIKAVYRRILALIATTLDRPKTP